MDAMPVKMGNTQETFRNVTPEEQEGIRTGRIRITVGQPLQNYGGMRICLHHPDGSKDEAAASIYFLKMLKLI